MPVDDKNKMKIWNSISCPPVLLSGKQTCIPSRTASRVTGAQEDRPVAGDVVVVGTAPLKEEQVEATESTSRKCVTPGEPGQ